MGASSERSPRVLVVDDYADAAELMAELLRERGCDARTAPDGHSALEIAAEFEPDIAFIDIGLPVMDGYEVGRRFRALPRGADLLLVALTGHARGSDRRRSEEAGFDLHLVKPIDVGALGAVLAQAARR